MTDCATVSSCSSLSTEHGPAITWKNPSPTVRPATDTCVSSGWKRRFAALYGSEIRRTSATTSLARSVSGFTCDVSPTRPRMVDCVPAL